MFLKGDRAISKLITVLILQIFLNKNQLFNSLFLLIEKLRASLAAIWKILFYKLGSISNSVAET